MRLVACVYLSAPAVRTEVGDGGLDLAVHAADHRLAAGAVADGLRSGAGGGRRRGAHWPGGRPERRRDKPAVVLHHLHLDDPQPAGAVDQFVEGGAGRRGGRAVERSRQRGEFLFLVAEVRADLILAVDGFPECEWVGGGGHARRAGGGPGELELGEQLEIPLAQFESREPAYRAFVSQRGFVPFVPRNRWPAEQFALHPPQRVGQAGPLALQVDALLDTLADGPGLTELFTEQLVRGGRRGVGAVVPERSWDGEQQEAGHIGHSGSMRLRFNFSLA